MATEGRKLARKLTVSEIVGKSTKWFPQLMKMYNADTNPNPSMPLFKIYGQANGVKHGFTTLPDGKTSEWVKLLGNFRAVSMLPDATTGEATGEVMNAGACILPGNTGDAIGAAIENAQASGAAFALEVHVRLNLDAATKYEYEIIDKLPPQANDPLAALETALGINTSRQLAAPAATPAPTLEPTPAPTAAPRKR